MINRNLARVVPSSVVALVALAIAPGFSGRAIAQEPYPNCEPPAAGEYLLLVQGDVDAAATQIEDGLPEGLDITICNYLDTVITRVGGFTDADTAATWAQYLSDVGGLNAYVARPAEPAEEPAAEETPEATPEETQDATEPEDPPAETPASESEAEEISEPEQPAADSADPANTEESEESEAPAAESTEPADTSTDETSQQPESEPSATVAFPAPTMPADATLVIDTAEAAAPVESQAPETTQAAAPETISAATPGYDPKLLGDGYAVLVEYFDQPEIAASVQDASGQTVGLVAYNQKPYLLVSHTTSSEEAGALLSTLSSQFTTILVDSSNVILLSPAIATNP